MTDNICDRCGARKERYDVYDPETGDVVDVEVTCPNRWRHGA